ncbi:MAG: GGDEF domain-containing protein, partial [Gammaproteobacteria bacterium]
SMTVPMMSNAMFWVMVVVAVAPEARGVMLLIYLVIFLFGVFRLNVHEFLVLAGFALGGYLGAIGVGRWWFGAPALDARGWLYVVVLAASLGWVAFFGSYVGRLRARLRERNHSLREALERINSLVEHDELTGAHNRRFIMRRLQEEFARVSRTGERCSIVLLDLDRFKQVNDRFGHLTGDAVLREFVGRVSDAVRSIDEIGRQVPEGESGPFGRFGGEEFLIVLAHTGLSGALRCAERVRSTVERNGFRSDGDEIAITVSAGVAEYQPGESVNSLLARADRALYAAKEQGRNRVECSLGAGPGWRPEPRDARRELFPDTEGGEDPT